MSMSWNIRSKFWDTFEKTKVRSDVISVRSGRRGQTSLQASSPSLKQGKVLLSHSRDGAGRHSWLLDDRRQALPISRELRSGSPEERPLMTHKQTSPKRASNIECWTEVTTVLASNPSPQPYSSIYSPGPNLSGLFKNIFILFFKAFHFVLGYSQLTMLWGFQVNSERTQPYMYVSILP